MSKNSQDLSVHEKDIVSPSTVDYGNSSLTYDIYNIIKENILFGKLAAGEKLNIAQLSKQYSVSRTPVKCALELLEKDNLILNEVGKQAVVKQPSAQEIKNIYLFRRQLEPVTAKMSVKIIPTSELYDLKKQLDNLQLNPKMYRAQIEFDRQLHVMLWKYLDSRMVESTFHVIDDYSARVQSFIIRTVNKSFIEAEENNVEHMAIIDAILERDGEETKKAVQVHLMRSCQRLLTFYADEIS